MFTVLIMIIVKYSFLLQKGLVEWTHEKFSETLKVKFEIRQLNLFWSFKVAFISTICIDSFV